MSSAIPQRELGRSGLFVSQLGLGCMGMTHGLGDISKVDRQECINLIREAFKLGINFFDTAECYGPFDNEELLGEAISTLPRDKIVLGTKCGLYTVDNQPVMDSRPETLRKALEGSLKRLRTDYIDLYYIHRLDKSIPIEDVARTMLEFKKEGKIRHWGLSEVSVKTIRRAHAVFPLTAVQSEYSIIYREPENGWLQALEELGIGFVPFSPLGSAFLTATVTMETQFRPDDFRYGMTRFAGDNRAHNMAIVELVKEYAQRKNATPAQIALAWVVAQKPFIVPIPGTTKMARMRENAGAAAVHFSTEEMAEFNAKLDAIEVKGGRYAPVYEAMLDR